MEDNMKIVKSLEDSGLLIKGVSQTIQNEEKEQKRGFINTLLVMLGANLLENMLASKVINIAGEEIIMALYESKGSLIKNFKFCFLLQQI